MMTARFFSGASLFALLIVDICCYPTNKGNPGVSHGGSYTNAAPNQGGSAGPFSPGAAVSKKVPKVVSVSSYQPVAQHDFSQPAPQRPPSYEPAPQPSFSQPAPQRPPSYEPAPQPIFHQPAVESSTQPGTAFQSGPREVNWAVAPPSLGEKRSSGTRAVASGMPENVSPNVLPPGPQYQAGELSNYESALEHGDYQMETEEQGFLPPPPPLPMQEVSPAGEGYTSPPQPEVAYWGPYPPYYDYRFLMGLYPPGTVTHSSSSYEQGSDHWQDVHYEKYHYPDYASPAQQTETFTDVQVPQTLEAPSQHAQPSGNYMQPTYQAGGKVPRY